MVIFASKNRVGLEIDVGEIRAVELSGSISTPRLIAWGSVPLEEGDVEDGVVQQPEQVKNALLELWDSYNFKSKNVVLGVSNQGVLVRFAEFPRVPPDKLGGLIRYQAQDYLPIPLDSVILDYTIIGETTGEDGDMYEVILVAARREMLDDYLSILSAVRLNVWDIDVSSLALLKILPPKEQHAACVLVDIANGQSNILIIADNLPRLVRRVPVRLKDAAAIMSAHQDKLFSPGLPLESLPESYLNWIDTLVSEIRSSISYYQGYTDALAVTEIILSGKGARAAGLAARAEKLLELPVRTAQPFNNFSSFVQPDSELVLDFSTAAGLALRGLEE